MVKKIKIIMMIYSIYHSNLRITTI
jgi:hypothetical protein